MRRRIGLLVAAAVPAMPLDGLAAPTESPVATGTMRATAREVLPVHAGFGTWCEVVQWASRQEESGSRARVAPGSERGEQGGQVYRPLPPWSQKEQWNAS